jgi:putative aldouronate transport system permease protein
MVLPTLAFFIIFHYIPIYGVQIAFKDYYANLGIWGSPWVGFKHFIRFFNSFRFWLLIENTILLQAFSLIAGFPLPIILAILLHHLPSKKYSRFVQTVTYIPHFISIVVLVGMLFVFLSPRSGIVNIVLKSLGKESVLFMAQPNWFRPLYVLSGIWQSTGWGAIMYLAALSSVSPELHESATVDGASKIKRILHIDMPSIAPTIIILLILNLGRVMSVGFEKAYLMQTSMNLNKSEIIATYVYKAGLLDSQYSFSSAVGLFNSVVNFTLLISVNAISKKVSNTSLW